MKDIHGMLARPFWRIRPSTPLSQQQKDVQRFQDWEFADTLILVVVRTQAIES